MFSMLTVFGMAACTNSEKKEVKQEEQPASSTSAPAPASGQEDGTTIKVNNDGVSVESKDGSKKSNVSISKDSTSIEISRPK